MAKGKKARHAQRAPLWERLPFSPTALALSALAAVFLGAGALAVHILSVPAHLRQEGAAGPASAPGHRNVALHPRVSESRAARSEQRQTPTPSPSTSASATQVSTSPSPAARTSSARPSPRPSPSSSSSRPLPLPTLTRPPAG